MLRNPNKLDYTTVKSYGVFTLRNFLRNVCEKVVTNMLSEWFKINHLLSNYQMCSQRQRSYIDAGTQVVNQVQEV